jgi:hypothetical protein
MYGAHTFSIGTNATFFDRGEKSGYSPRQQQYRTAHILSLKHH